MFQTWEFKVSHGHLLIRSPKTPECPTNIDLMFVAVEYIDLPRHLRGLEMEEPNEADISVIRERLGKPIGSEYSIFVIISDSRRYHVVAAALKISENELDIFDSPFI